MSFHPLMAYDERFHKSERKVGDEGPPFVFTPERRAALDEILTKYPPDRKRSAVLAALYLVQEQAGYITGNGMRHIAPLLLENRERRPITGVEDDRRLRHLAQAFEVVLRGQRRNEAIQRPLGEPEGGGLRQPADDRERPENRVRAPGQGRVGGRAHV